MHDLENLPVDVNERIAALFEMCTDMQKLFVEAYQLKPNKAAAARAAGYSEATIAQGGWQVYNDPVVNLLIRTIAISKTRSIEELMQRTTDNAFMTLADCMKTEVVEVQRKVRVPLSAIIDDIEMQIAIHKTYMSLRTFTDEELKLELGYITSLEREIDRLESRLYHNPKATKIIYAEPELVEEQVLDMSKVVASNAQIKAVKYDKDGRMSIELCSPDVASEKLFRINGSYEKDNKRVVINKPAVIDWTDDDEPATA